MATLTTIDGVEITFNADGVAVISEDGAGSDVFGATTGMVKIRETPPAFMARFGIAAKFAQLTARTDRRSGSTDHQFPRSELLCPGSIRRPRRRLL